MKQPSSSPRHETVHMNLRFDGFRKTPFLWKESLEGLKMFSANNHSLESYPEIDPNSHVRLGKLIEQFVFHELEHDESVDVLRSNVQIFEDKRTIGEIDGLIRQVVTNIHLEISYKFYLYDPSVSGELDRWTGPNRKDSLVLKLNKLKEKQLPMLFHPATTPMLSELQATAADFQQEVYFKAQLFVPLSAFGSPFQHVNPGCIYGFYLRANELSSFTNHTFYIPSKQDWLMEPHLDVFWLSAPTFQEEVAGLLAHQRAPLCWMKSTDGNLQKFFVVWWS